MWRSRTVGLCAIAVLLLSLSLGSTARAQPETTTDVIIGGTDTFEASNPCTNTPGSVTASFNAVLHMTVFETGAMHVTGTQAGDFVFTPTDATQSSYTGHFAIWFGGNINPNQIGFWSTFNIKGIGSDGSTLKFEAVMQFHVSATGVTVEFMKFNCA